MKRLKKFFIISIIFTLVINTYHFPITYDASYLEPIFDASLSSGTMLETSGVSHTLVPTSDTDEDVTEKLTITFTEDLANPSTLTIAVPSGLEFVGEIQYSDSFIDRGAVPDDFFTTYDNDPSIDGIQQDTGTYINENAGTYTVLLQSVSKGDTIEISFNMDFTMWSRRAGSVVAPGKTPLAVNHIVGDDTYIKKIDTMNASNEHISGYIEMYIPPASEGGIEKVPLDGTSSINLIIASTYLGQAQLDFALKELQITMTKPNLNGNYASYVTGSLGENENDSMIVEETNTQLIITISNYRYVANLLKPEFFFSDENFNVNNTLSLNAKVSGTPYFGTQAYPASSSARSDTVQVVGNSPNIGIVGVPTPNNTKDAKATQPGDSMELLSIMGISNTGAGDVDELELSYDLDRNTAAGTRNKLDVVAINLPYPARYVDSPPEITITFQDEYGQNKITKSFTDKSNSMNGDSALSYITIDNSMVYQGETDPEILNRVYYIEQVTYTIPRVDGLEILGSTSNGLIGGIFGYANSTTNTTASIRLSFGAPTISGSGNFFTKNVNIIASSGSWRTPYLISSITTDKQTEDETNSTSNIIAGETVTIDATLGVHEYPYTNSTNVPNPIVYIVEPDGFNIKADDASNKQINVYKTVDGQKVEMDYTIDENVLEIDGLGKVYKVIINEGFGLFSVDYFTNYQGTFTPTSKPTVEVQYVADSSLTNSSINVDDLFFFVDENIQNANPSAGAIARYLVDDVYNLDATHIRLSAANETDILNIIINKNDIVAQANINESGTTQHDISNDTMENPNVNNFNYLLTIDNRSEDIYPIDGSIFYFPMIQDTQLTGEVKLSGASDYFTVYYSTTATESTMVRATDWSTTVDDYSLVTAIKITGNMDYTFIPGYSRTIFTIPITYTGNISITDGGENVSIETFEWERYIDGVENTENVLKEINAVTLNKKYISREEVTIVANPQDGQTKNVTVSLEDIPFITQLYVQDISPYNVNLLPYSDVSGSADTVELADENFGMRARVGTASIFDLSQPTDINTSIGTLYGGYDTLYIDLAYYDNFFDENTSRYVDLVFTNKAGVEYHIRINIEREPYIEGSYTNGIIGGKYYTPIQTNDSLMLTQDSAFTTQYVVPQSGTQSTMSFSSLALQNGVFPAGATITVVHTPVDSAGNALATPLYLYREVTSSTNTLYISGTSFKNNNTNGSFMGRFPNPTGTTHHVVQVVVDFGQVKDTDYLDVGEKALKLSPSGTATPLEIPFTITPAREISITTDVVEANANLFTLETTVDAGVVEGYDYKYLNKYAAIKISAVDLSGEPISPPNGSYITIDGIDYPGAGETYFINTIGRLSSNTYTYTFIMPLAKLDFPPGFEMTVQTDLYISNVREHGLTTQVASTKKSFAPDQTQDTSLDIEVTTPVISSTGDSYKVPLEIRYSEGLANSVLNIELYRKNENDVYELVSSDVISAIENSPGYYFLLSSGKIIKYAGGTFDGGIATDQIVLDIPSDIVGDVPQTYRILIKSSSTLNSSTDFENFILLP